MSGKHLITSFRETKRFLIYSVCWFPWCSHYGQFQATSRMTLDLALGGDERNGQRTTELVNPIIEHLLGTRAWNQAFPFLNSSHFHLPRRLSSPFFQVRTGKLWKVTSWINSAQPGKDFEPSAVHLQSLCTFLLGSIQSLAAQKPP